MIFELIHALKHAGFITLFVVSMMLIIDFMNVLTKGSWQQKIRKNILWQHIIAALLGAFPGCLGTFAIVSMYIHRIIKIGALVTVMIATSGDEAFVMFAMFPKAALVLTLILIFAGITTGLLTDLILKGVVGHEKCCQTGFQVHEKIESKKFAIGNFLNNIKKPSFPLIFLSLLTILFMFMYTLESFHHGFGAQAIISLILMTFFLMVTLFSNTHFLKEHIWEHIFIKHAPKMFLWTLGALLAVSVLDHYSFSTIVEKSPWIVLFVAAMIGFIPDSGPHLVFVILFASGTIPFSILVTSSIVQDGHGALPLLSHSRRDFFVVKGINTVAGIFFGVILLTMGY
jgi:Putative, 10TM heavy-metal exporter